MMYKGGDKENFISDACFLLILLYQAVAAEISAVCVAGIVLPSPCKLLPRGRLTYSQAFV